MLYFQSSIVASVFVIDYYDAIIVVCLTFLFVTSLQFVYGGERIASHDLRRLLQDPFYRDLIPPDRVYELIDLVDFNPGKAVSYAEFVHIVSLTIFQSVCLSIYLSNHFHISRIMRILSVGMALSVFWPQAAFHPCVKAYK